MVIHNGIWTQIYKFLYPQCPHSVDAHEVDGGADRTGEEELHEDRAGKGLEETQVESEVEEHEHAERAETDRGEEELHWMRTGDERRRAGGKQKRVPGVRSWSWKRRTGSDPPRFVPGNDDRSCRFSRFSRYLVKPNWSWEKCITVTYKYSTKLIYAVIIPLWECSNRINMIDHYTNMGITG